MDLKQAIMDSIEGYLQDTEVNYGKDMEEMVVTWPSPGLKEDGSMDPYSLIVLTKRGNFRLTITEE